MKYLGSFNVLEEKRHKLDVKDRKILYYLLRNSRMSFSEIGRKTGLSKESVQYRYKQLLSKKIIHKSYARVNFDQLGFQAYQVNLLLDESKAEKQKEFFEVTKNNPNVIKVITFSDNWDAQLTILGKDIIQFDEILEGILEPFEDIIQKKESAAIIEYLPHHCFPDEEGLGIKPEAINRKKEDYKADKNDILILAELSKDSRISTYAMQKSVGLSSDAIRIRIKKLYNSGIIQKFTCQLNYSKLSYQGFVFIFSTSKYTRQESNSFRSYVTNNKNIRIMKRLIGAHDVEVQVVVKNPVNLHKLIREIKGKFSDIIRTYETWVIYQETYFNPFPDAVINSIK